MSLSGLQHYKNQSLNTMTQSELLLLLLDELVKRLMRAEIALEQNNIGLFDESLQRCYDIVRYLDDTLDMSYEIGRQLHRLYDFFCFDISRIRYGRNQEELSRLKPMLMDLRDAFREADRINSGRPPMGQGEEL